MSFKLPNSHRNSKLIASENVSSCSMAQSKTQIGNNINYSDRLSNTPTLSSDRIQNYNTANFETGNKDQLLKELLEIGLIKGKAEKALAATAHTSSIDAISWLLKHSNDHIITNADLYQSTRDYILVLCPVGLLASQIESFLKNSRAKCGSNNAHFTNALPFIKLTSFFRVIFARKNVCSDKIIYQIYFSYLKLPDHTVSRLHSAFNATFKPPAAEQAFLDDEESSSSHSYPKMKHINIDLHVSSQMILLYPDIESENIIKSLVQSFCQELSRISRCREILI